MSLEKSPRMPLSIARPRVEKERGHRPCEWRKQRAAAHERDWIAKMALEFSCFVKMKSGLLGMVRRGVKVISQEMSFL